MNGNGEYSVECENLTRRYGDFVAVDHVTLRVKPGEIYGFLGPNGAGKTTTIKMLCGLEKPSEGSARVADCDIARDAERLKGAIGYMSQLFSLYEDLTVEQNIRFFADVYLVPRKQLAERKRFVLSMAGIEGRERMLTGTLPQGLKQRLALGCAVIHQPTVLFLDEPTAGVDPLGRRRFWELIYSLAAQRMTVFVTTHYMDEAENCHRVAFLRAGKLIATGDPAALRRENDDGKLLAVAVPASVAAPERVAETLGSWERLAQVTPFGSSFHVRARSGAVSPAELDDFLRAKGLSPEYVRPIRPSLEDVFLHMVEERGEEPS
ncbi:MAG TPA: ABC transporter ATP-binding protein [bacterium]|nr:ABC transporter ATP-binding protein [bacterium]